MKVKFCYQPGAAVFMMLTAVEVRIASILLNIRQQIAMAARCTEIERKASNA